MKRISAYSYCTTHIEARVKIVDRGSENKFEPDWIRIICECFSALIVLYFHNPNIPHPQKQQIRDDIPIIRAKINGSSPCTALTLALIPSISGCDVGEKVESSTIPMFVIIGACVGSSPTEICVPSDG